MTGILQGVIASIGGVVVTGQEAFTTVGTFSWVAPAGVTKVSVVVVGSAGTSGQGGALSYKNNYTVTPANSYTVSIPANSGGGGATRSYFIGTCVVSAGGGTQRTGDGGGNANSGAGGYSGNGGAVGTGSGAGGAGTGGAGGGGGRITCGCDFGTGGGGGVGLLGQGCNGAGGSGGGGGGGGGSGGSNGTQGTLNNGGNGGLYGGASGQAICTTGTPGTGAVRIIWPGCARSFPSTNTGNV